jgi:hypothetical protein
MIIKLLLQLGYELLSELLKIIGNLEWKSNDIVCVLLMMFMVFDMEIK